jgi:hypothetical protein
MAGMEQSSSRAWSRAPEGYGASSRRGASSRKIQRVTEEKKKGESTYTTS